MNALAQAAMQARVASQPKKAYKDIARRRFGSLVAERYVGSGLWNCFCDCGAEKEILGALLRRGDHKTCGLSTHRDVVPKIEMTGRRFGLLTVKSYAGAQRWNCLCECGAEKVADGKYLRAGYYKSCGDHRTRTGIAVLKKLSECDLHSTELFDAKNTEEVRHLVRRIGRGKIRSTQLHGKFFVTMTHGDVLYVLRVK